MKAIQTTAIQANDELLSDDALPPAEVLQEDALQVLDAAFLAYVGGGTGVGNMQ